MKTSTTLNWARMQAAGALLAFGCVASTGCQIDVAGQTLPSPYHLTDDVQYYAPGPEFKLANEAAALAEQHAAEISEPQIERGAVPRRPAAARPAAAAPAIPQPPQPAPPAAQ